MMHLWRIVVMVVYIVSNAELLHLRCFVITSFEVVYPQKLRVLGAVRGRCKR